MDSLDNHRENKKAGVAFCFDSVLIDRDSAGSERFVKAMGLTTRSGGGETPKHCVILPELEMELVVCVFPFGYAGSLLRHDVNLAFFSRLKL